MRKLEIPERLYRILREIAESRGVGVVDVLIEELSDNISRDDRINMYLELHEEYLREAKELHKKGNLVQASEKYWGAICSLLNAIGEAKRWRHFSHRDYEILVNRLWKEMNKPELPRLFSSAERLHANFYHNFLEEDTFRIHEEDVEKLISILREYLKRILKST